MFELPELLRLTGALLEGHFVLSSGLHSDSYIQCARLLQHPQLAEELCKKLALQLQEMAPTVDAVLGPALGGVLVAHEVARALRVRAIFAERENGALSLRRGFTIEPGERVLIVEDVVTTGLSAGETTRVVSSRGATTVGYGALVCRSDGHGLSPFAALWQLRPRIWNAMSCPLCTAGVPLYRPGSRAAVAHTSPAPLLEDR